MKNEVMWVGPNSVGLLSSKEEIRTQRGPREDTGRRQVFTNQRQKHQEISRLLMP